MGKGKKQDKQRRKGAKQHDSAQKAIARAERRLVKALARVEEARGDLVEAEATLTELLRRNGRLPATETGADDTAAAEQPQPGAASPAEEGDVAPTLPSGEHG